MSLGPNISTCNEINSMLGKPSIDSLVALKGQRKIVCLTAYSAPMTNVLDPHCDLLLVGDSVGMVVYGLDNTQNVDLNTMIRHGQAVMRQRKSALVVIDMPSGSYETNPEQALVSANEVITKTGADALADAGVFGIVMEGIVEPVAASIAKSSKVITIGIGASATCDGQILVTDDMLGLYDAFTPKFVRKFTNLQDEISGAVECYCAAVIDGSFPAKDHLFLPKKI